MIVMNHIWIIHIKDIIIIPIFINYSIKLNIKLTVSSFRNLFHVHAQSATYCSLIHHHPVSMRAAPTATEVGSLVISDGTANRSFALSTNYSTTQSLSFDITTSSFANTPQGGTVANGSSASNYLTVDSEL